MAKTFAYALAAVVAFGTIASTHDEAKAGNGTGLAVGLGILALGAMANSAQHAKPAHQAKPAPRQTAAQKEKAKYVQRDNAADSQSRAMAARKAKQDKIVAAANTAPEAEEVKSDSSYVAAPSTSALLVKADSAATAEPALVTETSSTTPATETVAEAADTSEAAETAAETAATDDAGDIGCKKYIPAIGVTISVDCDK